jgi:hypothetical protein
MAADMIDLVGETVTLRRVTGPSTFVSVKVKAKMSTFVRQRDVEPGAVKQFYQQFIISNREIAARQWPGPPRRGDQIVTSERAISTVQSCDVQKVGDVIALFVLQTTGEA